MRLAGVKLKVGEPEIEAEFRLVEGKFHVELTAFCTIWAENERGTGAVCSVSAGAGESFWMYKLDEETLAQALLEKAAELKACAKARAVNLAAVFERLIKEGVDVVVE